MRDAGKDKAHNKRHKNETKHAAEHIYYSQEDGPYNIKSVNAKKFRNIKHVNSLLKPVFHIMYYSNQKD